MTQKNRNGLLPEIKTLMSKEEDFLRPLVEWIVQQVLEIDMSEAVGAEKRERTEGRLGYRSGYYPRKLITRVGTLELRVPQDRQGRFSTEVFARYQRSEKALVAALVEMYVQGVSTRKVKAISEELWLAHPPASLFPSSSSAGTSSARARSASSMRSWTWSWSALRGRSWSANTRIWCSMRATSGCARRG